MNLFDVIVVGCGGVGSAVLLSLAKRGARVLGLDRFGAAHDRGSSHGQTRLIRQAYFEHPDYVPLLLSAYEKWHDLEQAAQCQLLFPAGLLEVGPPEGVVLPGVTESAQQHGLEIEKIGAADFKRRFPQFELPPGCSAVLEPTAGVLLVESCVKAGLDQATKHGAQLQFNEPVVRWSEESGDILVETVSDRYRAGHLIIAAGAWSTQVLDSLGLPLRVVRKHLHWFGNQDKRYSLQAGSPAFLFELSEGCFYGFPEMETGLGVKAAEHSGGDEVLDPTNLNRSADPRDLQRVLDFIGRFAPGVSTNSLDHRVCMYTLTPDEHFILDFHPRHPQVCFAAGLSGHGFKFAPVLAEVLADLTLQRDTVYPVAFFGLSRFGLT